MDAQPAIDLQRLLTRISHLESMVQEKTHTPTLAPGSTPDTVTSTGPNYTSDTPVSGTADTPDVADAATVLEFLAWGRRKDQDFHDTPENDSGPRRHSTAAEDFPSPAAFADSILLPQLDLLEILLPNKQHVFQLVEFHGRCLSWYHCSYMASTLAEEVNTFYTCYQGSIRHPEVNLQWVALLFAVLTGSITCASSPVAASWGFVNSERARLSKQWFKATKNCLDVSNYMEIHTIYSVQAISTLTISAHILGFSNTQSVLLATAARLAQSLGIHRLGEEDTSNELLSESETKRRRKRETGRRVWCQLCTQDWFSIPFSESYSLNSTFFNTAKPLNCLDQDMLPLPRSTPTITSYCNYLYDIASLIPQLQDAMNNCNTLYTKYEQVILHDEKMRKLATAYMPTFFSNTSPVASDWPAYVPWARRSLAICAAHKIIMIHRKFLGLSFSNSAFAFTRRTCIAASKTILKEARAASDDNGPVLWIDQAFVVAAGIILCLDAFHRKQGETEYMEHKTLGQEAISYLSLFPTSMIASRGVTLLSFLTKELAVDYQSSNSRKRTNSNDLIGSRPPEKRTRVFSLSTFIRSISSNNDLPKTPTVEGPESAAEIAWDVFADMFPPQTGFGGELLFNSFFDFEL